MASILARSTATKLLARNLMFEFLCRTPRCVHDCTLQTSNGNEKSVNYWAGPDFPQTTIPLLCRDPERVVWYVDGVERKRYETAANVPAKPMNILFLNYCWSSLDKHPGCHYPFPTTMILTTLKCEK